MATLSPSGEVAEFLTFSQFASGESVDQCGPASVSTVFHATAPGTTNTYTAAECEAMMIADYEKYIGPDTPADHGGTSDQTLYNMLAEHGFHYQGGPARMSWVKAELALGKIVIIGIVESSVHDNGVGGVPYAWDTSGLTHIIVASGPGNDNEVAVRDTANIGPSGVRPGPRFYDTNKLQLVSATSVTPSWLGGAQPVPSQPAAPDTRMEQAAAYWQSTNTGATYDSGIAASWQSEYKAGRVWGPPLTHEFDAVTWTGQPIKAQMFAGGRCEWDGSAHWYTWA